MVAAAMLPIYSSRHTRIWRHFLQWRVQILAHNFMGTSAPPLFNSLFIKYQQKLGEALRNSPFHDCNALSLFEGLGYTDMESQRESKGKDTWVMMSRGLFLGEGFMSWPPKRSYSCCFCKRVFMSAQALGGHMNVHRRDKARLRGEPPTYYLCLNPNPDLGCSSPVPNLNMPPPPSMAAYCENLKSAVEIVGFVDVDGEEGTQLLNLDLEIGPVGGHGVHELDLELRLGVRGVYDNDDGGDLKKDEKERDGMYRKK